MTISANRTIADPGTITTAVQAVQAAIAAADTAAKGVIYGPFSVQVAPASSFNQIWIGNIAFYQFTGSTGPWLPLGDVIGVPADNFAIPGGGVLCFAPDGDPAALAHPVGFRGVVGDQGSGNPNDVEYWWPVAPAGYTALGLCFNNSYDTPPDPANYWCVKTQYLQTVSNSVVWNDQGAGWDGDGTLFVPAFSATPETPPQGNVLILPPTLLSGSDLGNELPFALVGTLATNA